MPKHATLALLLCASSLLAQNYIIKGPAKPKSYETTAVKELTAYLKRRIAGTLAVDGKSPITFQIGDTDLAKANGLLSTELPDEEWHIKSVGDQVILNGGGTRGALYATYHFLEDYCGIHWWSDTEDYVPQASSLELEKLDASGKPAFLYRDIYRMYKCSTWTSIRNRLNRCGDEKVPGYLGGSLTYGPPYHCHTFMMYIPAAEYLTEHPEYFALNGKRRGASGGTSQLCMSNPDLKQIFLDKLMNYIKEGEEKAAKEGTPAPKIYDISQNDNLRKCDCPNCKAEAEKYGQSGLYLNFVNWLARELKKTRPDLYLSMLAYHYTEPPPKGGVRADDNVIVKLCDTQTNIAASILEPENKKFHDFVAEWKNYAKNVIIWDYAIIFTNGVTGMPFASEFHYGDLYKHYLENNVKGIFWEHEKPEKADFYELKFFLECKLFEDPYQDVNALIDTFMNCYYGAAAPFMLEYRQSLDATRKAAKAYVSSSLDDFKFITNDDIIKYQKLFDSAEAAVAGDKVLEARVRHARCGLDRLTCTRCATVPYHGNNPYKADERLDFLAAAKRQIDAWPKWCLQFPKGGLLANEAKNAIRQLADPDGMSVPVPEEFKDRNFYDFLPYRLDSHDKNNVGVVKEPESPTGETVKINVAANDYYDPPFVIGYYQLKPNKSIICTEIPLLQEPGYHWYNAGTIRIPPRGYLYITRNWTYQLQTAQTGIIGNKYEIWAHVKVTGPKYRPGDTEKDYIFIDRILLVEPKE